MNNRFFGVELETISTDTTNGYEPTERILASVVPDERIDRRNHGHWSNHNNRYGIEGDGSISETENFPAGVEVITPKLAGEEGREELKKVMLALDESGKYDVNASCGTHVHVDAHDKRPADIVRLYRLYAYAERLIDYMHPASRRAHSTCASIISRMRYTPQQLSRTYHGHSSRYSKVNLHVYYTAGRIEFRQHAGTLDYQKIVAWIDFVSGLVEHCQDIKPNMYSADIIETNRLFTLLMDIADVCTDTVDYLAARIRSFKGGRTIEKYYPHPRLSTEGNPLFQWSAN